jgi:hypothetical protein
MGGIIMKNNQPRDISILLQIMLNNIKYLGEEGLCHLNKILVTINIVNAIEYMMIYKYLKYHNTTRDYWFPQGLKIPRINWLRHHIKITKQIK